MSDRSVCWFCKYFNFTASSPGYSEWTPGNEASIDCDKDVWQMDLNEETEDSFREKLSTAATCDKFKARG
jgi:hypothetical protein